MTVKKFFPFLLRRINSLGSSRKLVSAPDEIFQLAFSFQASRVLLAAVELEVFTIIDSGTNSMMTPEQLHKQLRFYSYSVQADFLDCLVSMNLLVRVDNSFKQTFYSNTPDAACFLVKGKETYVGDCMDLCSRQLYKQYADLTDLLKQKEKPLVDFDQMLKASLRTAKMRFLKAKRQQQSGQGQGQQQVLTDNLSPDAILRLGFGFWPSRTLLSAAELKLFTVLEAAPEGRMTEKQLREALGLQKARSLLFLDTLVKFDMLEVEGGNEKGGGGNNKTALYQNTSSTAQFLDAGKVDTPYVGDLLIWLSQRSYWLWADLPVALRTAKAPSLGTLVTPLYKPLYSDNNNNKLLLQYANAQRGWNHANLRKIVKSAAYQDLFKRSCTLLDVGGATGQLACYFAIEHRHLLCTTLDLPALLPVANEWIAHWNMTERVKAKPYDFTSEQPFPKADIITLSHILSHATNKKQLLRKAYYALPDPGSGTGALIMIESLIDAGRKMYTHAMCDSLNLLLEFGENECCGNFTALQIKEWCLEVGFVHVDTKHMIGPSWAIVAYKKAPIAKLTT